MGRAASRQAIGDNTDFILCEGLGLLVDSLLADLLLGDVECALVLDHWQAGPGRGA